MTITAQATSIAAVTAALLLHQVAKLSEQRLATVGHNHAPVFGFALPASVTAAAQLAFLPAALVVAVWSATPISRVTTVALVIGWLLSVQRRLSNHAWLGTVAIVAMALVPAELHRTVARDLLIGLYLSAALFKVNDEYLFSDRSAGRILAAGILQRFGVVPSRGLVHGAAVSVLVTEFALGLALVVPSWTQFGLCAAVVLHWFLGISGKYGNFHFSIVAMTLWAVAMSPENGRLIAAVTEPAVVMISIGAGVLALARGRRSADMRSASILAKEFLQGAAYALLSVTALAYGAAAPFPTTAAATWIDLVIATGFLVNLGLVIAGLKLDWSFAMFSSLRPFGDSWLHRPRFTGWPRYYALTLPDDLPAGLLRTVTKEFLDETTRPGCLVHESVVRHLEAMARSCGTTLTPRVAAYDPRTRSLVVQEGGEQPAPRSAVLVFPAVIPSAMDRPYLG